MGKSYGKIRLSTAGVFRTVSGMDRVICCMKMELSMRAVEKMMER